MTSRTGILKNSPLIYALASIRFAPWPLMAQKIDEIHDELRDITPLINRIQVEQIGASGQFVGQNENAIPAQWVFISSNRMYGFILAPDQLLFFSREYTRYADFASSVERGLNVLFKHMRFMDITNMGVRYVDHIKVIEGKVPSDYVAASLLPAEFDQLDLVGGTSMGSYRSGDAELRVRCTSQLGAPFIPEDMISLLVMTQEPGRPVELDLLKINEILLDMDAVKAYPTLRMNEAQDILAQLNNLHQEANKFFRRKDVCTDFAFDSWRGNI